MDPTTLLDTIGLQERESKVYLALLEVGESTVLPIAKKSGIKRTYCYDILESLIQKKLVSYFEKNNRRRYVAEDPKIIEKILKERLEQFTAALPELRSVYNQATKPKIRYYEGPEAPIAIAQEIGQAKAYDAISSPDHVTQALGKHAETLAQAVAKNKVKVRELHSKSTLPTMWTTYHHRPLQEVRQLPEDITITTDIVLWDDKLALIAYEKDIHTITIESSGIVDTHRILFELLWSKSEPSNI